MIIKLLIRHEGYLPGWPHVALHHPREKWEYEADQRHADMVVEALGLGAANGVATPGEIEKNWEEEQNNILLQSEKASKFRSIPRMSKTLRM